MVKQSCLVLIVVLELRHACELLLLLLARRVHLFYVSRGECLPLLEVLIKKQYVRNCAWRINNDKQQDAHALIQLLQVAPASVQALVCSLFASTRA